MTMETETGKLRLLEPGDRSRPATTPSRRSPTVSSFKHGHNGRRTKLTNGLLRAISDIIEDVEILSISHLNQELLARGHSLSRSTVFRAMEILGMRMDRDKKRWCIGGSGGSLGMETTVSHFKKFPGEGNKSGRMLSAKPPRGSFDEKLLCEANGRGLYIYNTGQLELIPSQYNRTPSNYSNSMGSTHQQKPCTSNNEDLAIPAGSLQSNPLGESTATGVRDSAPGELSCATKRFIDSHANVQQPFPKYCRESDRSSKTPGLHRVIKEVSKTTVDDGQTPSKPDRQLTYQKCDNVLKTKRSVTSVWTRNLETGGSRSRKRKSDCPAKITPTSHTKSGTAKKQSWLFTPQGSSTVYGDDEQEYFNSTPQEDAPDFLPLSSRVPWLTNGSPREATTKGTSGDTSNRGRDKDLHLSETQTGGVMANHKPPVDGRGRDGTVQRSEETKTGPPDEQSRPGNFSQKPPLPSRVMQNHQTDNQRNIPDGEALCKNGTTSDSQIPHTAESAQTLQRSDQKLSETSVFQSQQINEVEDKLSSNGVSASTHTGSTLNGSVGSGKNARSLKSKCRKINQAPKMSQTRYGGHDMSSPRTELSQIVIDTGSTDKVRGNIDEQGQKTSNVLQREISKEGRDLRLQPTDRKRPMLRAPNVQQRPVNPQQASRSLRTDDSGTPSVFSDPKGSSSLTMRPDTLCGTDSQTARLHALTSSLAVKTSSRATSRSPRSEGLRWENDVESVASTRMNCYHNSFQPSTAITPSQNTAITSSDVKRGGYEHRNFNEHTSLDADAAQSAQDIYPNISEIRFWMQDISQKMVSMQQQLNYLTQVMTDRVTTELPSNEQRNAMSPSTDHRTTGDLEEQQVDRFSDCEAGDDDDLEDEEDEEEQDEMQRWGRNFPPINTLESEDMISTLLSNARWESLSPFVGGPRLAIQLARDCIFGPEVLMRSTVTGRNGMNPLHRDGIKKIKDCMMEIYGTRCSQVEFELLWKMARESLSQLCKRIRRRHTEEVSGQEVNSREVNGRDAESYEIIKPEMD